VSTEDTTALLAQLREVHLPEAPAAPSVWPVALALLLLAIALLLFIFKRRPKKAAWSDEAISSLRAIKQNQPEDGIQQTASLLRRVVLTHDTSVRHQTGDTWLDSLDRFFNTTYFSRGHGRIFGASLYASNQSASKTLYRDIENLIRKRRRLE